MKEDLFRVSLLLSDQLRAQYSKSLGNKEDNWENVFLKLNIHIPDLFRLIYNCISGTKRDILEQELMDYIPGYRLIHISEFASELENIKRILSDELIQNDEIILPILANYSSDYICYCKCNTGQEYICSLMHDCGELIVIYNSPGKFLETVCQFYIQGVYFLDADGYLDFDINKESIIGLEINPDVAYWNE